MGASNADLLLEIGCEEIPARMIAAAAADLERRVLAILDEAGLDHGAATAWGGPRRLSLSVAAVCGRQEDRDRTVLGPPAKVALGPEGEPLPAALGFAKKQGIDPGDLESIETERGSYVGYTARVVGKSVGEILSEQFQSRVAAMSFPKMMRWADATYRWVRPVHWVVALHGKQTLDLTLFGIQSGNESRGHRFRSRGAVRIKNAASYAAALAQASVMVDPADRRERIGDLLARAAEQAGGQLKPDAGLLNEVSDLVECPGVVLGRFEAGFLDLPAEILATTLRHHQKCFSLVDASGNALAAFLAVANTDCDPEGHIQRGNEWVVGGRLEDARFFWLEDRRRPLSARSTELAGVIFHAKVGTFAEKAARMERIVVAAGEALTLADDEVQTAIAATRLCKNDLVTGTVGEFPELQGQVGGLLLGAEGRPEALVRAVYEHYRPAGAEDALPESIAGALVSVADKLDSIDALIAAGETPTGSRDPLGLRRAVNGIFRIVTDRDWVLSVEALTELGSGGAPVAEFLADRAAHYFKEAGASTNEIQAVLRPRVDAVGWRGWPLPDVAARLRAIASVRDRQDFEQLADLTKRVDNILTKRAAAFTEAAERAGEQAFNEDQSAAIDLAAKVDADGETIDRLIAERRYDTVIELLSGYVDPVERFFADVLVLDPENPAATVARRELLHALLDLLTRCFDVRELAGQAG